MKRCPFCHHAIQPADFGPTQEQAWAIINEVADQHGITPKAMLSKARGVNDDLAWARSCAAKRLRNEGFLLKEIGLYLGGRNHATIIHALKLTHEHNSQPDVEKPVVVHTDMLIT